MNLDFGAKALGRRWLPGQTSLDGAKATAKQGGLSGLAWAKGQNMSD
jgi:hypothetical protein